MNCQGGIEKYYLGMYGQSGEGRNLESKLVRDLGQPQSFQHLYQQHMKDQEKWVYY